MKRFGPLVLQMVLGHRHEIPPLVFGEDGRGVAETIQTSLSHQPAIMDLKMKFNYNFLLLH